MCDESKAIGGICSTKKVKNALTKIFSDTGILQFMIGEKKEGILVI